MAKESRIIFFSGRVQGVGFRYTAVQLAKDLPLHGTVRNLPDGGVELHVHGPADAIDSLIGRLREHFGQFIRTVEQAPASLPPDAGGVRITW